jgi:uncharacterized membrane protein (DUF2068 family)
MARKVYPRGLVPQRRDRIVVLIAVFKLVKAVGLIAGALAAFELLRPERAAWVKTWLVRATMQTEHHLLARALRPILNLSRHKLEAAGVALLLYAALFLTEGVGLLLERTWAEYLTVFATASLIPFEVWEVAHRVTVMRIGVLLLNIAVVIYLWVKLKRRGSDSGSARRSAR